MRGKAQKVTASVVDTPLRELIGSEFPLTFDQPSSRPAAFSGDKVTVFLRSPYETEDGEKKESPLLVSFPYQEGAVIFTSFHNEAVNSEIEAKLLKFVVFTAVTKKVETRIDNKMVQLGFSPAKKGVVQHLEERTVWLADHKCPGPASLQFVLGFSERGARLKLTVKGPDGKIYEKGEPRPLPSTFSRRRRGSLNTRSLLDLPNDDSLHRHRGREEEITTGGGTFLAAAAGNAACPAAG